MVRFEPVRTVRREAADALASSAVGTSAASVASARARSPEDFLLRASRAQLPSLRARYARRGLATRAPLDRTTQAMLLRQLSLSHYELRRFAQAREVALQALDLDVLADVLHQDVARAALGEGDLTSAIGHLRRATRRAPASRRSFHYFTLGSLFFLSQRYPEALAALERATRWATVDKPLCRAHRALVEIALGKEVADLQATVDELASAPCARGYGEFVLGHLAYATSAWGVARRYLARFIRRTEGGRVAVAIALDAEVRMARTTLIKMSGDSSREPS